MLSEPAPHFCILCVLVVLAPGMELNLRRSWGKPVPVIRGACAKRTSYLLPGATLQKGCYANMFRGCSSLVDPPDLMAIDPVPGCYFGIFRGCTSLTGMKCLIILDETQQGKTRGSIADTGFPTPDGVAAWSLINAWTVFNKWLIDASNVSTGEGLKYNSAMPTPNNVYTNGDQVGKVPAKWPREGIPAPTS